MTLILEGCQLDHWLKLRGISRAKFSKLMGVSRATVTDWCKNKQMMTLSNALLASHLLKCSVHDLYPSFDPDDAE
jgi:transcriptional regulator with XRE-family HTH domain